MTPIDQRDPLWLKIILIFCVPVPWIIVAMICAGRVCTRIGYRFACWLDLWMHDVLDRHLTFVWRGKVAAWVHAKAHDLAYVCRAKQS